MKNEPDLDSMTIGQLLKRLRPSQAKGVFVSIVASLLGAFALGAWVTSIRAHNDLPGRSRPAIVFDTDGRVLGDAGALDLLERVPEVMRAPVDEKSYRFKIVVRPKTFAVEPVIESLDVSSVSISAQRGQGLSWEILISSRGDFITDNPDETRLTPLRYRLELMVK